MPNYDYVCETCGHEFEVFQSMKDPKLTDCPQSGCNGKVKRLLGKGAGLIFKGSGFYGTDYRSPSYQEAAKKEESASKPKKEGASGGESAAPKPSPQESKGGDTAKAKPASSGAAA